MLMRFYAAGKPREWAIADAVGEAARNAGFDFQRVPVEDYERPDPDVDVACIWGVKRPSSRFMKEHKAAGIGTLMFDKGFSRRPPDRRDRYRVSANAFQPTAYMQKWKMPGDRFRKTGVQFNSMKTELLASDHILIVGSSQKAHAWFPHVQPTDAMQYYRTLVRNLRQFTDRKIIWRPKPSWRAAEPIEGTTFSTKPRTLGDELHFAAAAIVTASGASFETLADGTPTYVMPGFENIADGIAGISLKDIDSPMEIDNDARWQWCSNVAYTEWTIEELKEGQWLELLAGEL